MHRLHSLRNITDTHLLKAKAQEFDRTLNRDLALAFAELLEPAAKRKLQQQIARLLLDGDEQKVEEQDIQAMAKRRAELMSEYRKQKQSGVWKQHKFLVQPSQDTLRGVKSLVRENAGDQTAHPRYSNLVQ